MRWAWICDRQDSYVDSRATHPPRIIAAMSDGDRRTIPDAPRTTLRRRLGLWSATAVLVGSTVGSGIFRSPAGIAARLPGPLPLLGVWLTGGMFALCGALTLAEIAGALPDTGGLYVFIREGWGRLAAFLFGWSELIIIRAASLGAISTTFAEYLFRLAGRDPTSGAAADAVHWVAALAIGVTAAFNYRGLRWGSTVQNVTTVAKYGGLLLVVLVAMAIGFRAHGVQHFTPVAPAGSFGIARFGLALVSVLWAFDGWADLSFVAGEVADPRRVLPRAIIGGTLAVIAIYLLANVAYLAVLPVATIRASPLVAADVAQSAVGHWGAVFVAATVVVSTFGTLNATLLTAPRVFFAMASDGLLLRPVAAVHPRYGTPFVAVMLVAALGVAFVMLRTFDQLADTFVTAIVPFYALGVASIFVLRRRATYDPPFRVPGYPLIPALFVLATIFLIVNAIADPTSRWATVAVFGTVLLGVPVYLLTVRKYSAAHTSSGAA
jgi:amino acid transporter